MIKGLKGLLFVTEIHYANQRTAVTQDVTFATTLIKHNEVYWFVSTDKAMIVDAETPVFFDLETTGLGITSLFEIYR